MARVLNALVLPGGARSCLLDCTTTHQLCKRQRRWALTAPTCHPEDMAKRYLRTADAARELGIGRNSLSRWAKAGKVTPAYVTPGGQNHWDMDDLHRQLRPITEGKPMIESPTAPEPQPVVASIVTSDLGVLVTRRTTGNRSGVS